MTNINLDQVIPFSERQMQSPFTPKGTLPFGELVSDHMFLMDYSNGEWHSPRIVPYGPLEIVDTKNYQNRVHVMPNTATLHYCQTVFEGAKAFQHPNGELYTFRIDENCKRLNHSARKLCMKEIPPEVQSKAINTLLDIERLWMPQQDNASIYIRPFIFGTGGFLGVKSSVDYIFCTFLSPSGSYFPGGFEPIKLMLTDKHKRVAPKSVGTAKTGGNYAASLEAAEKAKGLGAKQVLYMDVTDRFIEETGAMNVYMVTKDQEIIIPEFTDTILESITSRSFLELGDRLEYPVFQEKVLALDFVIDIALGEITENGGLGTAATVAPVGTQIIDIGERKRTRLREMIVGDGQVGPVSKKMYDLLTGIQTGRYEAPKDWVKKVERRL
jgi:branched-chain amino acid aminotransferase